MGLLDGTALNELGVRQRISWLVDRFGVVASEYRHFGPRRLRKRWLVLALPVVVFAGLVAIAPGTPERRESEPSDSSARPDRGEPFDYIPDDEVYALELDPRKVRFDLLEGWDREQDAYEDLAAHMLSRPHCMRPHRRPSPMFSSLRTFLRP